VCGDVVYSRNATDGVLQGLAFLTPEVMH